MATVYQEIVFDAPPDRVWAAVCDVGAVHERLFPGYVTDARLEDDLDGPTRVVTFAGGLVVRERIVAVDEAHRRVAWTAVGGRATYHHASMQVRPERLASGGAGSRLVWTTDVLPDAMEAPVRALVEGGAAVLRRALGGDGTGSGPAARAPAGAPALGAAPRGVRAPDARLRDVPMLDALHAAGPAPALAREMALFGRLVGSWDLDVVYYAEDGSVRRRVDGEWHFGWALEGRAVADVWMAPRRAQRGTAQHHAAESAPGECGLTLRFYDPRLGAWRSTWHGPVHGLVWPFVAREVGDEVVLERTDDVGALVRWIFSEVEANRFRWRAVESTDGGETWRLQQTMAAVRRRPQDTGLPRPGVP